MEKKAWRGGREKRRRYASKTDGGSAKRCKQDGRTFWSVRLGEVFLQSALFPGLMDDRGWSGRIEERPGRLQEDVLQEDVFQDEEQGQYGHEYADLLVLAGAEVEDDIGDQAYHDAVRNGVGHRHQDYGEIGRD